MACCPTCGRAMPQKRTPKASGLPERHELDAALAEGQILRDAYYKACKAIAIRDDARFFLRVAPASVAPELYAQVNSLRAELETRPATAKDAAFLYTLKIQYRTVRERTRSVVHQKVA